jgi:hypothetical protein
LFLSSNSFGDETFSFKDMQRKNYTVWYLMMSKALNLGISVSIDVKGYRKRWTGFETAIT